jgi:hypothetical protein
MKAQKQMDRCRIALFSRAAGFLLTNAGIGTDVNSGCAKSSGRWSICGTLISEEKEHGSRKEDLSVKETVRYDTGTAGRKVEYFTADFVEMGKWNEYAGCGERSRAFHVVPDIIG